MEKIEKLKLQKQNLLSSLKLMQESYLELTPLTEKITNKMLDQLLKINEEIEKEEKGL